MDEIMIALPFQLTDKKMTTLKERFKTPSYTIRFVEPSMLNDELTSLVQPTTIAVISRGGIGDYFRKHLHVPIIDVPVTSYDLLETIRYVHDQGFRKLRIIVSANIFSQITPVQLALDNFHIEMESYTSKAEIGEKIELIAMNQEADIIIGDRYTTDIASNCGLPSHLLQSGEEALQIAVKNAIHSIEIHKQDKAKLKELKSILFYSQQAVVTVNGQNEISIFNEKAQKLFPDLTKESGGKKYETIFPYPELIHQLNLQQEERDVLVTFDNKKAFMTTIPIFLNGSYNGAVQIFEELSVIQKLELEIRKETFKKGLVAKHTFHDIITVDKEMNSLIREAASYAKSEGTVVIYGETGTGKELFTQSIHNASHRATKPFVSLNCGVLNESLLESELFGYEEGAFTGAIKGGKKGLFELAHGGTLFLDEINEMPLSFQTKLLRVIQEKEVRRVGGERYIPVDVRIICATNRRLNELIDLGKFREDLYYRMATLELDLLPLRKRKADIIPLALNFLEENLIKEKRTLKWENDAVFEPLLSHNWYGNVRELQNFIHRLVITFPENTISKDSLSAFINRKGKPQKNIEIPISTDVKEMETAMWQELYREFNGTKAEFCEAYQISQTTLWRKLRS